MKAVSSVRRFSLPLPLAGEGRGEGRPQAGSGAGWNTNACAAHPLSPRGERGKEKGFSLLEILVAFAIAAMALGLLYQIMGSNARQVGGMVDQERAMLLAESLLDIQRAVPEAGLNETGQAAGYMWQIESRPYPTPAEQSAPNAVPLHEVRVTVQWGEGRQFTLTSVRPQARPLPLGLQ